MAAVEVSVSFQLLLLQCSALRIRKRFLRMRTHRPTTHCPVGLYVLYAKQAPMSGDASERRRKLRVASDDVVLYKQSCVASRSCRRIKRAFRFRYELSGLTAEYRIGKDAWNNHAFVSYVLQLMRWRLNSLFFCTAVGRCIWSTSLKSRFV